MRRHGASPNCAFNFFLLFCNHPTRDAIAGVSGGVRLVIVGLGMNHNCSAFAEKGMRAVLQCDVAILKMDLLGRAIGAHGEVFHITGMVALGILESVLLSFWVEMSTRGFKVGAFALRNLMEMDGVPTWRGTIVVDAAPEWIASSEQRCACWCVLGQWGS